MEKKQSKLKPYNQLIQQLKYEGLYLTQQKKIKLPVCLKPSPSIISRIASLISPQQKSFNLSSKKQIYPIQQNLVIIIQCNTLSIYTIEKSEDQKIILNQKQKFHMEQNIEKLTVAHYDNFAQTNCIYFILTYQKSNLMSLFSVKNKHNQEVTLKHQYRAKQNIIALQFISKTDFLLVSKKYLIYEFKIEKDTLKMINQICNFQELNQFQQNNQIVFVKILSHPRQDQQTLTAVFYALWNQNDHRGQLSVKQMVRQLDHSIYLKKQTYQLFTSHFTLQDLKEVQIVNQRDYFLLQLKHQIFVITKLYQKYVRLDAITQKSTSFKSLMISHYIPLICCVGPQYMQLWHISVKNRRSTCTLMDVINIIDEKSTSKKLQDKSSGIDQSNFIRFWVMTFKSKIETIFAVDRGGRDISFFGVKKIDKVSKLVNKIIKTTQKNQIKKVQQLGKKLGVDRKSLYLKLWQQNPKTPANIYQYLLQSYDLSSIHSELQKYMRKKFISAGQLIKIHCQIQKILQQLLKQNLDFKLLKWFAKTNFQKRKLNLFSMDYAIDFKKFDDIYKSGIFDLIKKSINMNLFPQQVKPAGGIACEKQQKEPQINIQNIMQQFKLVILQNYQDFLFEILNMYKFSIVQVFEQYPYFLPKHPFKMQIFKNTPTMNVEAAMGSQKQMEQTNSKNNSQVKQKQQEKDKNNHSPKDQKIWFSQITQSQWSHQKSSVDYIFNFLYPHHPTHQIMNILTQLTQSQWNRKNKYKSHSLINTTKHNFKQKMTKIEGIHLYLSVSQFINRAKRQANIILNNINPTAIDVLGHILQEYTPLKHITISQQDFRKNQTTRGPKFLQIMNLKNNLKDQGYQKCLLYCKMHDLMIAKEIMKQSTTIFQLMTMSHSSLIAKFFLGNKQRNAQLFRDFMPIYNKRGIFYESLNQYIKSKDCSRVQLQILVNQLKQRKLQLKQQNQNLAELLIYGFCLRTQIRQRHQYSFLRMFQQIKLQLDLAIKLQKISAIQTNLSNIFLFFMCQKMNYEQILKQPHKVIRTMMQNYFQRKNIMFDSQQNNHHQFQLKIQQKSIPLDIVENTLPVLLYLKQQLYIQMQQIQLFLLYGKVMIEWEQFQILKDIFYQHNMTNMFDPVSYFQKLIAQVLDDIYSKEDIYMNQQTVTHIQNILALLQRNTPLKIRQRKKLQLSKILQKLGFRIPASTLQLICIKWKQQNRQELFLQIIQKCIQYFDLQYLQSLYTLLQSISLGKDTNQTRNVQSIKFAYSLAHLLTLKQSNAQDTIDKISKIIYFLNKGQKKFAASLQLMAQNFLQIITKKYKYGTFLNSENLQQFQDLRRQDRIKQDFHYKPYVKSLNSNHLNIHQHNSYKINKSFQTKSISFKQNIDSRFIDKSFNADNTKNLHYSQGNISKKSLKSHLSKNPSDPFLDSLKFDDQTIAERIFNSWNRSQKNMDRSTVCQDIIQIKQQHLKAKQAIQYFILNWDNIGQINEMFRNNFVREVWQINISPSTSLKVNESICINYQNNLKIKPIQIDLNLIWSVNVKACSQYIQHYIIILKHRVDQFYDKLCQKYCKILYYGYFYILMGLKCPQSLQNVNGVSYQFFVNFQSIYCLQKEAFQNRNVHLQGINFQQIWSNFHNGIKKLIITKIKYMQLNLKIPQNTQIKTLQRIISQIDKSKTHLLNFYMKILIASNQCISKYLKQQKPKALKQLKILYESMFLKQSQHQLTLQVKKKSTIIKHKDDLRISLKQTQQIKEQLFQRSQHFSKQQTQGVLKEIAEAFNQIKYNHQTKQNLQEEDQHKEDIKELVLKKILSKRELNYSMRYNNSFVRNEMQSLQFLGQIKQLKSQRPFQSSIILQTKNQQSYSPQQKDKIYKFKNNIVQQKNLKQRNSFQSQQYFKSQKQDFESLINIKSQNKNPSNYSQDFLQINNSFQQNLHSFNIPYIKLIYPVEIIKIIASKDIKFQNKYHLQSPVNQQVCNQLRDFAKLLNSYQLYVSKNSKYYIQDSIKKIKNNYPHEKIISFINQIYFQQDSILITLNKKQLEANKLRKQKGLGSQQQKFKKTKFSFILKLINNLSLNNDIYSQYLLQQIQKLQNQLQQQISNSAVKDSRSLQNSCSRISLPNIPIKNYLQSIFPIKDLINNQNIHSQTKQYFQNYIEGLFGRIYLSNISTNQSISLQSFKKIIQFFINYLALIIEKSKSKIISELQIQKLPQKIKSQSNIQQDLAYTSQSFKNYLVCMLIWQILKYIQPSFQLKQKLQYLIGLLDKEFLVQIFDATSLLLKNNSQLQGVFNAKILNIL